jgi:hypothetical protein
LPHIRNLRYRRCGAGDGRGRLFASAPLDDSRGSRTGSSSLPSPPVSPGQAASEAVAEAVAKRQPVAAAAGPAARRIPRAAPPESGRQPARGEPFFRQRRTSFSSKVEGLEHNTPIGQRELTSKAHFWFPPGPQNIDCGRGTPRGRSRRRAHPQVDPSKSCLYCRLKQARSGGHDCESFV